MAPSLKIFKILHFFKGFGRFWPRIGKKIQQKTQFPRHLFNSVSDCRFNDFHPFSVITENHWPYWSNIAWVAFWMGVTIISSATCNLRATDCGLQNGFATRTTITSNSAQYCEQVVTQTFRHHGSISNVYHEVYLTYCSISGWQWCVWKTSFKSSAGHISWLVMEERRWLQERYLMPHWLWLQRPDFCFKMPPLSSAPSKKVCIYNAKHSTF